MVSSSHSKVIALNSTFDDELLGYNTQRPNKSFIKPKSSVFHTQREVSESPPEEEKKPDSSVSSE